MKKLEGKVAIITGGTGGIGLATAELFLKEGAKVMIADLYQEEIDKALGSLHHPNLIGKVADISQEIDNIELVKETVKAFGRLDIYFANAGIEGKVASLEEYPLDLYQKIQDVNVKGPLLGMRSAFPEMRKVGGGSFIITSSVAGMIGTPKMVAYTTSKHATLGLMKTGALEGAPDKIRVNSIHPSPVDNRMMRSLEDGFAPGAGEAVKASFEQRIPLRRYATNEEIANLALFLASEDSSFITGTAMTIDGGMTA